MADRQGRLEDRPLRICAELFPYRRSVTEKKADAMLRWLSDNGFIIRYEVEGRRYIQVVEFLKHQNPHKNEAPSKIPVLSSVPHSASTVLSTNQAQDDVSAGTEAQPKSHSSTRASSLTPDSGLLTPCTRGSIQEPAKPVPIVHTSRLSPKVVSSSYLEMIKLRYPKFSGNQTAWLLAERHCEQLIQNGEETWESLLTHTERYAAYVTAGGVSGPQYVRTPDKHFDPRAQERYWREQWEPPETKAERRLTSNVEAALEAKRRLFGEAS
jgi:hypothetical protein